MSHRLMTKALRLSPINSPLHHFLSRRCLLSPKPYIDDEMFRGKQYLIRSFVLHNNDGSIVMVSMNIFNTFNSEKSIMYIFTYFHRDQLRSSCMLICTGHLIIHTYFSSFSCTKLLFCLFLFIMA